MHSGSTGTVTVSGSGSTWNNSNSLYVGFNGTGSLTITDGGSVTNIEGFIGDQSGSTGTVEVSGSGSTWNNTGNLDRRLPWHGHLTIESGGSVTDYVRLCRLHCRLNRDRGGLRLRLDLEQLQ